MADKEDNLKQQEIKKKKPTVQYYQPPRGRLNDLDKSEVPNKTNANDEDKLHIKNTKKDDIKPNKDNQQFKKSFAHNRAKFKPENEMSIKSKIENQDLPEEVTKKFGSQENTVKERRGGILKINISELRNERNEDDEKETIMNETNNDSTKHKTLFDPYNPSKPILIRQKQESARANRRNHQLVNKSHYESPSPSSIQEKPPNSHTIESDVLKKVKQMEALETRLKETIEKIDFNKKHEKIQLLNDLRKQLASLCIEITLNNIEKATKSNIDLNFWRSNYHQLIETLRKEIQKNGQNQKELTDALSNYLKDGLEFYENFIQQLQLQFKLVKNDFISLIVMRPQTNDKNQKLALMCIHRCLICLGDLARYKEMIIDSLESSKNYIQARTFYIEAMHLAPKSSRSYNQLAILSLYTRRRLDAVYYYLRCLELQNPLLTARQSLLSLFDEARKRSESISENLKKKSNKNIVNQIKKESNKIEIWIKPNQNDRTIKKTEINHDDSTSSDEDEADTGINCVDKVNNLDNQMTEKQREYKKLSSIELNKRFMLDYLNTIGKLFTRVGMESYSEVCSRMLYEFNELLRRNPCPIGKIRLLQITIINISIIDLTKSNESNSYESNSFAQRSQLQESAVQLALDMFSLLCLEFEKQINCDENILPSIKIFIDWMINNLNFWLPLPDQLHPDLGPNPDLIKILVKTLNNIKSIRTENEIFQHDGIPVQLEEDIEVAGFLPFQGKQMDRISFVANENNLEIARNLKRIEKIESFGQFLSTLKEPPIKLDEKNLIYVPIITRQKQETVADRREEPLGVSLVDPLSKISLNDSINEKESESKTDDVELNELIEKRKLLKAKVDEQIKREQSIQSFVESDTSRKIELEIRPRFLITDTNCFIDHLNLIDSLIKCNRFIVVVPLIVINELDKLSKSILHYNDDSVEHAEMVQRNAKKSIDYLNEKFESRERNLKALTSQGSTLETIQFRSEEIKAHGTNDDLILGCCLHYCRDNARNFMPNNSTDSIHLYREVVLLTDDRNLRLKAHTRHVPVKNILSFCRWSKIAVRNRAK